ncbi:hypothetical protein F5051DRAFT_341171, partial [Lentinula edodes]
MLTDREIQHPSNPTSLAAFIFHSNYSHNPIHHILAYKHVAQKVQPIPTVMPDYAKVIRRFPEDPLLTLPSLSRNPPQFLPGARLTEERLKGLGILKNGFLWPEERLLMADVLKKNEMGIAWDETEKGRFREDYFPPLKIPMIAHTPWADRTLPIPPGIRNKV